MEQNKPNRIRKISASDLFVSQTSESSMKKMPINFSLRGSENESVGTRESLLSSVVSSVVTTEASEAASKSNKDDGPSLFQGQMVRHRAGCCSKGMGNWVKPLIDFTNSGGKLSLELYGDLPDPQKAKHHIDQLESAWNKRKHENGDNVLLKVLFVAFWK